MKLQVRLVVLIYFFIMPSAIWAKEVRLQKGEIYRDDDLVVICEGNQPQKFEQPLAIKQCQYWDEYAKKCLFEKTTYSYNNLVCVEECGQWDSYRSTCDYLNKCEFNPTQEVFIMKTCANFDTYSRKCLKSKEELLDK